MSMCVCSQLCQLTVKSCQPPPTVCNPTLLSVFLLLLPIPLSDEQIELLNELFLWAPNAHPQLSICSFSPSARLSLPPSTHPSILLSTPKPHSYLPSLPAATMFISTGTGVPSCTHTHSHLHNALMCAHIINLLSIQTWAKFAYANSVTF